MSPQRPKGTSSGVSDHPVKGEGGETAPQGLPHCPLGCGRWRLTGPCPGPNAHRPPLPPQACRDFLELAETHSRKWQRALQYEQEQRVHLEETIEQLAKQHNSLERAFRSSAPGRAANPTKSFSEGEWAGATSRRPSSRRPVCCALSLPSALWLCLPGPQYTYCFRGPHETIFTWLCISCACHRLASLRIEAPVLTTRAVSPAVPSVAGLPRRPPRGRGHEYPGKGSLRKGNWATGRLLSDQGGFQKERGL